MWLQVVDCRGDMGTIFKTLGLAVFAVAGQEAAGQEADGQEADSSASLRNDKEPGISQGWAGEQQAAPESNRLRRASFPPDLSIEGWGNKYVFVLRG